MVAMRHAKMTLEGAQRRAPRSGSREGAAAGRAQQGRPIRDPSGKRREGRRKDVPHRVAQSEHLIYTLTRDVAGAGPVHSCRLHDNGARGERCSASIWISVVPVTRQKMAALLARIAHACENRASARGEANKRRVRLRRPSQRRRPSLRRAKKKDCRQAENCRKV